MAVLPPALWDELDKSLGEIDLRLSPERALARLQELFREQGEADLSESLFVSFAAVALVGAFACRTRREAQARQTAQREARVNGG